MWGVPLEPSLRYSGLEEVQLTRMPPGCSVYELLHNLEQQFRYFKDEHLKSAFQLCVGARSRGKLLVLDIQGREMGTLLWSQGILVRVEEGGQPHGC